MLNRRLVRIKVFQTLYSFTQDEQANRNFYEKQLLKSLAGIFDVYYFVLAFPSFLKHVASLELETEQAKHFPSDEEIKLHQSIVQNSFIGLLENNSTWQERTKKCPYKWENHMDIIRNLFIELKKDEHFRSYALASEKKPADQRKIIQSLLNDLADKNELFNFQLEETHLNWQDDKEVVMNAVNKSLRQVKDTGSDFLYLPDSETTELEEMARDLYGKVLLHDTELNSLIEEKTKNWDVERIAVTDTILLKMALCEILYFPSIPVKVTINEYLEIAKLYSTPNSKNFINGILDAIQKELKASNKVVKEGRGLIE
ncbi:MAG: transcription antitermination factor NusB [Bacteroidia bacterium]|nr:transcription antitermination factor NusB [Bacteroidia bacterium]